MKLCSIDTSLNEEVKAKLIAGAINPEIAQVKINIVKKRGPGLDREILEKSHVLFISLPRKKITQEQYIDLISYIDIGGCLILTLPSPPWTDLGRFFEEFRKEIGISFQSEYVYGLPKIPIETRLIGSNLTITKAHVINIESDRKIMKDNGIKEFIPLALMDNESVVVAAHKRRGRFIVFSSPEVFNSKNSDFLSRLIRLVSKKLNFTLPQEMEKKQIGSSNFSILLQHGCLDNYLLSLFHYNYDFHKEIINLQKEKNLPQRIYTIILKQKVPSDKPTQEEIQESLLVFKVED